MGNRLEAVHHVKRPECRFDLNPIKITWNKLRRLTAVRQIFPFTVRGLDTALLEDWNSTLELLFTTSLYT